MKFARVIGGFFGAIGLVLMLGTVGVCLYGLNHSPLKTEVPQAAVACSEQLAQTLSQGELEAAARMLYGQPELGLGSTPSESMTARFWDAFRGSIACEFSGECYVLDGGFARDVEITARDVEAMARDFQTRSHDLMNQRVEAATEMSELYDEDNNFRPELIDEVMEQACQETLNQNQTTRTWNSTWRLVCRDDQWWVVPDEALLSVLSAGLE